MPGSSPPRNPILCLPCWLDSLCTLLLWCDPKGQVLGANQAFLVATGVGSRPPQAPSATGSWRRPRSRRGWKTWRARARRGALRGQLRRPGTQRPVQVLLCMSRWEGPGGVLLELAEMDQQARQDREERVAARLAANKGADPNLAHEIKIPLGGLRGAGPAAGDGSRPAHLREYTQVITHEADRLRPWSTACWPLTAWRRSGRGERPRGAGTREGGGAGRIRPVASPFSAIYDIPAWVRATASR